MNTPPPRESHANSISFLRLAFAMLVVLSHTYLLGGFWPDPLVTWSHNDVYTGLLAVQAFFVLSGALVAASYSRLRSFPRFLWHRALRLVPAYWICLFVTAFFICPIAFTASGASGGYFSATPSPWGYVWRNLLLPRSVTGIDHLFAHNPWILEVNGSVWTLFYEVFCYLVIAMLGLIGLLGRDRRVFFTGYVLLAIIYLIWAGANPAWLPWLCQHLFHAQGRTLVLFFLSGAAWTLGAKVTHRWNQRPWLALACMVLLIVGTPLRLYPLISPFALAPVLFWLGEHLPFRSFERSVGGDYSYGLYLYGYPVQQTLALFGAIKLGMMMFLLLSLIIAGILAVASWHLVEKHALRLKSLGTRRHRFPSAAPVAVKSP
jgi:peptidoglycan/LPS O-acetylase OafA/YrhL